MTASDGSIWRDESLVRRYLDTVRGAMPLAQTQLAVMVAILGTREEAVTCFLDVGCGDGILSAAILGRYPQARGVLADFSEPMLDAARQRLEQAEAQLQFLALDLSTPGWLRSVRPAGPFDTIVSGFSIHHLPDDRKRDLYREIHELLAPGGWFVHLEHVAPATATTTHLFQEAFIEGIMQLQQRQGLQPDREEVRREFARRGDKQANLLAPVELQCQWLREIGFVEVDCYLKIYELAVFAGRKADEGG